MRIGGYILVVEPDGREFHAIDSLGIPSEGREIELWGAQFVVTRVRHRQDVEERSTALYTHPLVYIRAVGTTPPLPPSDEPDDDDSDRPAQGAAILRFEPVADPSVISLASYQSTDADELAELRAQAAHEVQCMLEEHAAAARSGSSPRIVLRRVVSPRSSIATAKPSSKADSVSAWWAEKEQATRNTTTIDTFAASRAEAAESPQIATRLDYLAQSRAYAAELAEACAAEALDQQKTDIDQLAEERARIAHQLQLQLLRQQATAQPTTAEEAAPRSVLHDEALPPKTIAPWSSTK